MKKLAKNIANNQITKDDAIYSLKGNSAYTEEIKILKKK